MPLAGSALVVPVDVGTYMNALHVQMRLLLPRYNCCLHGRSLCKVKLNFASQYTADVRTLLSSMLRTPDTPVHAITRMRRLLLTAGCTFHFVLCILGVQLQAAIGALELLTVSLTMVPKLR